MFVLMCQALPPSKVAWWPTDTTRLHRWIRGVTACRSWLGGLPAHLASWAHTLRHHADSGKGTAGGRPAAQIQTEISAKQTIIRTRLDFLTWKWLRGRKQQAQWWCHTTVVVREKQATVHLVCHSLWSSPGSLLQGGMTVTVRQLCCGASVCLGSVHSPHTSRHHQNLHIWNLGSYCIACNGAI